MQEAEVTHSVESHLAVSTAAYDAEIRRFVPGYEAMLTEAMDILRRHLDGVDTPSILDLGAGTGALTEAAMAALPRARFTLLDADAKMLDEAKVRLSRDLGRAVFVHGSFFDPLPTCDLAMASLSLHHVHEPERKRELYANIRACLADRGALVTCDAMIPTDDTLRTRVMNRWAEHLVRGGDSDAEARARFASWADEDRYFSLDEEIAFLSAAGFGRIDIAWRVGPLAILVGTARA